MKWRDLFRSGRRTSSASSPDITLRDTDSDAEFTLASTDLREGRLQEALQRLNALAVIRPDFAPIFYQRGNANNRLGNWQAALDDYDQAVLIDSQYAHALCNRGTVLARLGRWEEALASYDRALAADGSDAVSAYNRADALRRIGRIEDALASYDQAIASNPAYADAYVNRGHLLHKSSRLEEAAASYGKAIDLYDARRLSAGPLPAEQRNLLGLCCHTKMQVCDWRGIETDFERIAAGLRNNQAVVLPMPAMAMLDDPALNKIAAQCWIAEEAPANSELGPLPSRRATTKIRIGYFSADFRLHPVSLMVAGWFERHDRSRFELTAFAFGPPTNDPMRLRLQNAFDSFVDVSTLSDREVAALARDKGIDIAVNLNGLTADSRTQVFALRAAPLQISFLGYPGTMGADYMDYLVADATVIPRSHQQFYQEKILYLPQTFMPFDRRYEISDKKFTRQMLGLPAEGFVFCCFNNNSKITPEVFDVWMRLLSQVQGSVLWLGQSNPVAAGNLRREAERRGVDARRLIFASHVQAQSEHLARLRAADLFLDTYPYNAHSTAVDALWSGLPVLTRRGDSFASRVASSLLSAVGIRELIVDSAAQYEAKALELAASDMSMVRLRKQLAANLGSAPLFDTDRGVRALEEALEIAHARSQSGRPLDHVNEHLLE